MIWQSNFVEIESFQLGDKTISIIKPTENKVAYHFMFDGLSKYSKQVIQSFNSIFNSGHCYIVYSMKGVSVLSDIGLAGFQRELDEARQRGGDIRLCEVGTEVLNVIELLGMNKILKIYQTQNEAIQSFTN